MTDNGVEIGSIDTEHALLGYYTARDAMRASEPVERALARKRDARRRKTKHRREYLASEPVREKEASRLRAVRAAQTPEQREKQALRTRDARARARATALE